jgi:hypothetical protein
MATGSAFSWPPARVTKVPDFSSRPTSSSPRAWASSSRLPKALKPKYDSLKPG